MIKSLILADLVTFHGAMTPSHRRTAAILAQHVGDMSADAPTVGAALDHCLAVCGSIIEGEFHGAAGSRVHLTSVASRAFKFLAAVAGFDLLNLQRVLQAGGTLEDAPALMAECSGKPAWHVYYTAVQALTVAVQAGKSGEPGILHDQDRPADAPSWATPLAETLVKALRIVAREDVDQIAWKAFMECARKDNDSANWVAKTHKEHMSCMLADLVHMLEPKSNMCVRWVATLKVLKPKPIDSFTPPTLGGAVFRLTGALAARERKQIASAGECAELLAEARRTASAYARNYNRGSYRGCGAKASGLEAVA